MANLAKIGTGSAIGIGSGAAGMAATLAAFTLSRSESFSNKAAQGLGVGVTPYAPEAFGTNLKMYLGGDAGAQALFGGLTQQRTTIGGPAYLKNFLARFGVKTTGKETQEELAADVLRAERAMATDKTIDPQLWQKYVDIFKVGNVADINTMMRFRSGVGGNPVSSEALERDIAKALELSKGGPEGQNLIELQKQFNDSMINVGQQFGRFADLMAGWFLKNEPTMHPATPTEKGEPFGILPPTPDQKKKGDKWRLHLPLDNWWDHIKGLFSNPFGSPAKAGELGARPRGHLSTLYTLSQ